MVGDAYLFHMLYNLDEDFQAIFKVRADFDVEMPNNSNRSGATRVLQEPV